MIKWCISKSAHLSSKHSLSSRWPTGTWKDAQHSKSSRKYKSKPQWDTTSHLSEWPSSKRTQVTSVGEDAEKENPRTLLVHVRIGTATVGHRVSLPQNTGGGITSMWPSNPSPGKDLGKTKKLIWKDTCIPKFIAIIYSCLDMEAT